MQINSLNQEPDFALPVPEAARKSESVKTEIQRDPPPEQQDVSRKSEKLNELKETLAEYNISLNFSRDEKTNELIVKLVDSSTGEAIRQTPSEVSLKLTAIYAKVQGQFLDERF